MHSIFKQEAYLAPSPKNKKIGPQKDKFRSQIWNFYSQNPKMTFENLDPRRKYSMSRYIDIYCNNFVLVIAYCFSHIKCLLASEFSSFSSSEGFVCPKEYQINWILVNNDIWLLSCRNCNSVILSRNLRGTHSLKQGNRFINFWWEKRGSLELIMLSSVCFSKM